MKQTFREFVAAVRAWRLWTAMALIEIQMQYRRSVLGPFWLALNYLFTVCAIGIVFSFVFRVDYANFIPYVATGLLIWNLLSAFVSEATRTFTQQAGTIRHVNLPLPLYAFRMVTIQIIIAAHNLFALLVIFMVFPRNFTLLAILSVPGFLLYAINGIALGIILGSICARFRDVANIVINLMQAFVFITPIFWPASQMTQSILLDANPFYHYVELTRAPLLGYLPSELTLMVVIGITLFLWIAALLVYTRLRWQIVHTA